MSEEIFRTVARECEERLEEKRSLFLAAVRRVSTEEEATAFVRERRKRHPDARHTVFAYLLRSGTARYSDDSEPQGTAGMPTLEAIRRAGVEDVVVVTTRYFGGILLGAGGLTRAYAGVAHAALSAAGVAEYIPFTDYLLDCTYGDYQRILQEYPRFEGRERDCTFSERVQLTVGLPDGRAEEFCKRILDVSAGACVPRKLTTRLDIKEA